MEERLQLILEKLDNIDQRLIKVEKQMAAKDDIARLDAKATLYTGNNNSQYHVEKKVKELSLDVALIKQVLVNQ